MQVECCTVYELYISSEDSDYEETEEPITRESERKLACYIIKCCLGRRPA